MAVEPTAGQLPFDEAIAFFRAKLGRLLPSRAWTDTYGRVNSLGFAVAGAMRDDLLRDLHAAVLRALEEGRTLADFRRDFDAIVARTGWSYRGGRSWRARVIFETNLRSAYQAGRWQQAQRLKASRPYLRYVSALDDRVRPLHRQWHGTVLPVDHPWWRTHYPPNGWGCRCTAQSLSADDLARRGFKVTNPAPPVAPVTRTVNTPEGPATKQVPAGIDPGFEHNAGLVLEEPFVPQLAEDAAGGFVAPVGRGLLQRRGLLDVTGGPELPAPRPVDPALLLPASMPERQAMERFMAEFGAGRDRTVLFRDAAGGVLGIGPSMFETPAGVSKLGKDQRKEYLLLLAAGLRDPDEIWASLEQDRNGRVFVRRRYVARFLLPDGVSTGATVFEWTRSTWRGVTTFVARRRQEDADAEYLDRRVRYGVRLYVRPGEREEGAGAGDG